MGNHMSSQTWRKMRWKREKKKSCEGGQQPQSLEQDSESSDDSEGVLEIENVYGTQEEEQCNVIGGVQCQKEKEHDKNYKKFASLTVDDLPKELRHQAIFDYIFARGQMVVKIIVTEKSPANPKFNSSSHVASGYACICEDEIIGEACPMEDCRINPEKDHKVYGGILVTTNTHVLHDEFEAEHSEYYFFYESESASEPDGHGFALRENTENKDYVGAKIFVHNVDVVEKIKQYSSAALAAWHQIPYDLQVEFQKRAVAISHPHGWPKQVSFGDLLCKEEFDEKSGRLVSRYTCLTCKGSSGSPVLSGYYWNNPFVHSSWMKKKGNGESYFY